MQMNILGIKEAVAEAALQMMKTAYDIIVEVDVDVQIEEPSEGVAWQMMGGAFVIIIVADADGFRLKKRV